MSTTNLSSRRLKSITVVFGTKSFGDQNSLFHITLIYWRDFQYSLLPLNFYLGSFYFIHLVTLAYYTSTFHAPDLFKLWHKFDNRFILRGKIQLHSIRNFSAKLLLYYPWFQRLFARRKKREARRKSLWSHRLQISPFYT